jgi:hypothetical protein
LCIVVIAPPMVFWNSYCFRFRLLISTEISPNITAFRSAPTMMMFAPTAASSVFRAPTSPPTSSHTA